ncbi:MAG: carboxypeptidase regulatory-like domain-containing protein [Pyrinomonadaceae bacterium]|nr:carboxypeptidase regulatory-like domain-containing protein [Pyrinomonadaceae bacterium]
MKVIVAISTLFFLMLCAVTTVAQVSTGQISGTVKDPSGAAIPLASVNVVDEQTSFARHATTDGDGFYLVSNLPPGSYQVRVEQQGFKSFVRSGIQLTAGDRADISPALEVGNVSEVITVSTQGELVDTESGTVGQLVDGSQVRDLALNGRNPAQLLMLIPGVAVTTDQFDRGGIAVGGVGDFYVNGSRSTSNSVTVDGGSNQDSGNVVSQTNNVGVDFISEVKIASSGYSAEYGRFAGAQINFSTRRGTEEYHGTLFEFFRNDVLNARSFFAPLKEKLRLNNFGWNFGGPIPRRGRCGGGEGHSARAYRARVDRSDG